MPHSIAPATMRNTALRGVVSAGTSGRTRRVPRTSSGALSWDFLGRNVTARIVRGPLASVTRLRPNASASSPPTVRSRRPGHRGRHAPGRGGSPSSPGRTSPPAGTRPRAVCRSRPADPRGEAPSVRRAARHSAALASGPGPEEVDLLEAFRSSEDFGWHRAASGSLGQGEPDLGLSPDPRGSCP